MREATCNLPADAEYVALVKGHRRARARDFIDIHTICERLGIDFSRDDFREVVRQTFAAKKVPLALLGEVEKYRDFHAQDFPSVQSTMYASDKVTTFDGYFDYVVRKCRELESLWNV